MVAHTPIAEKKEKSSKYLRYIKSNTYIFSLIFKSLFFEVYAKLTNYKSKKCYILENQSQVEYLSPSTMST